MTENDESIQLEMVIESDHDNNDNEESLQIMNSRPVSNNLNEEMSKNNQSSVSYTLL